MITAKYLEKNPNHIVLGPVRLSYAHLFKKYNPDNNGEGKYQTSILIPNSETEALDFIREAIEKAKQEAKNKKWRGKIPTRLTLPLRDGEEKAEKDPNYEGHFFLTAKSKDRPLIRDRKNEPLDDEDEIYSGVWAMVSICLYGYNTGGNCGIAVGLNGVQKVKDGEKFTGRTSAEEDFEELDFFDNESDDEL